MASETKTSATSHSGWDAGDGRVYDDDTCRSCDSSETTTYFAYTYGFSIPAAADIDGVRVRHHEASSGNDHTMQVYLCNGTTEKGTPYSFDSPAPLACSTATQTSHGGSTSKWGMDQSTINSVVKASDFGVAIKIASPTGSDTIYEDGFEITVYYTVTADETRRASVTVPTDKEETRRAEVYVDLSVTRRAEVTAVKLGEEVRRASVNASVGPSDIRRATVSPVLAKGENRRSEVAATSAGDITRRAKVEAKLIWTTGDDERRAVVWAEPQAQDVRRASIYAVSGIGEPTRRSTISAATTTDDIRRAYVDVDADYFIGDEERRAVVTAEDSSNIRRAEVTPAFSAQETRRSQVLGVGTDVVRRARISVGFIGYVIGDDERRASVWVEPQAQDTRRAEITIYSAFAEPTRRAVVAAAVSDDQIRRVYVTAYSFYVIGDDERRATVYAEPQAQDIRRAEVSVDWDPTRRSEVTVYAGYFTGDDERKSVVSVPAWEPTRRAVVSVPIGYFVGDDERKATVSVPTWEPTRRAVVTVPLDYAYGDEERKAVVTVPAWEPTRRAEVTVLSTYWIEAPTRRAIVTVGLSEDVRRSEVTVENQGYIRRSRVHIYAIWLYGWDGRRGVVSASREDDQTRRAEVFRVLVGDEVRRTEVAAATTADVTRRSVVYAMKLGDIVRRARVTAQEKVRQRLVTTLHER